MTELPATARDSKRIWVFVLEFGYWAERQERIFGAFSSKARAQAAIDEFRADRAAGSPMPDKYWGIDILDSHDPPKPVIVELLLDVPTWVGQ